MKSQGFLYENDDFNGHHRSEEKTIILASCGQSRSIF